MTYYEEDNPEIESAENEGMPPHVDDEEILKMLTEVDNQKPADPSAQRHEEMMEMLGGIFIQLSRMYDVLMLSLSDTDRATAEMYHSQGKLLGDPPILKEDAWS